MCKCVLSVCVRVCVRVKLIRVFSECVTEGDCNALVDRVLRIRVAKIHKCRIFTGQFPPNSPIIGGSFAKIYLQLKAPYGSSPPCVTQYESIALVGRVPKIHRYLL